MSPSDDRDLVRRAREGEERAIRQLYERHAPRVYALVRRLAGDDALAEDWAQEAWIRALRALPRFRGDARFSTWLHRIAVNSALHGKRWSDRRRGRESAVEVDRPVEPEIDRALLRDRLEAALDELPLGMRHVIVLHDVEGYTHEEIGSMLGVTAGTSKSQLFKARAKMRDLLGGRPIMKYGESYVAPES